jgi:hypothetical protein
MSFTNDVFNALNGNKESKLVSKITLHVEIRGNEVYYETTDKRGVAKCKTQADIAEASTHFSTVDLVYDCLHKLTERLDPPEEQPLDVLFTNQPNVEEPKNEVKSKK